MIRYQTFELSFEGAAPQGSQAVVDLQAEFVNEKERKTVKGFYAGNNTYKVRFLPKYTGTYTWTVSGAIEASGKEECEASESAHGLVKAHDTHFEFEDGTRFLPFGTTIYALANQSEELIVQTIQSLKKAPFNKLRHCIFPKDYDYNHNEPSSYAFEKDENGKWDVNRPCFAFWDHFDEVLFQLGNLDIQSDLILFHPYDRWGFAELSLEENKIYLDYAMRRLAANPYIWWSIANEFDLVYFKTLEDWNALEEYIVREDPYGHLLSNHNCFAFYDFNRENVTHCCMQSTQMYKAASWIAEYKKPVVYDECCYEGNIESNWGNISAKEMVSRFWRACSVGAYATHGETFLSEDEVLWWSKGGVLKGQSPKRIGFLKEVLESIPGTLSPWQTMPYVGDIQEKGDPANHPIFKQVNKLMATLPKEVLAMEEEKATMYTGKTDHAFLRYFHKECTARYHMVLPEDKNYRIEVIDTWEMTRTTFAEAASGPVLVTLPGKEGMAVLAIENKPFRH